MIDPLLEELISLQMATRYYPLRPGGRKVHVSRVYRDIERGSHGCFLDAVRTPTLATSREAIARYFACLTEAGRRAPPRAVATPTRDRSERVERSLDRLGL